MGIIAGRLKAQRRVMRKPSYNFQLRTRPWQLQGFMCHPVLPGETLEGIQLQSRVATDPLENALVGWWKEYWFFYVKLRDLYDRDVIQAALLDPTSNTMASLDSATAAADYHTNGTDTAINWLNLCREKVVDDYFREEGTTFATAAALIDSIPCVGIGWKSFLDSVTNNDDFVNPHAADVDMADVGSAGGAKVLASEVESVMRAWHMARLNKVTDMTFEDFLRAYGVDIPQEAELYKPELIRHVSQWTYPAVTINPSDGVPSAAAVWSIRERADKRRFFTEPGFIVGFTATRPKVYCATLTSGAQMLCRDAQSWFSPFLSPDEWPQFVKVTASDPPLDSNTDDYWVDLNDLFMYGDQFVNFAMSATDDNSVALPLAALGSAGKKYATSTDADSLFKTEATLNKIKEDGVVNLQILGRRTDTTPMSVGNNATV